MKRYIISQGSLEMAHRNVDSELIGRVQTPIKTGEGQKFQGALRQDEHKDLQSASYNPNHPQIVRFYKKWGRRE